MEFYCHRSSVRCIIITTVVLVVSHTSRFLFNPFSIATCIGRPTSILTNTVILLAVAAAARGDVPKSILAIGFASYLSLYPVLLAPPLALLAYDRALPKADTVQASSKHVLRYFAGLTGTMASFLTLSYFVLGSSWEFLTSTYGVQLTLSDLSPNVGLWWYFFVEMFDSFRDFFLSVFWLHLISYVGAMTIRLRYSSITGRIICVVLDDID